MIKYRLKRDLPNEKESKVWTCCWLKTIHTNKTVFFVGGGGGGEGTFAFSVE